MKAACSSPKNILIFAQGRTGSTALVKILETNQVIHIYPEPFNPDRKKKRYHDQITDLSSLDNALKDIHNVYNGIKHLIDQLGSKAPSYNHHLLKQDYNIIFSGRKNLLKMVVSKLVSMQSGHWGKDREIIINYSFDPIDMNQLSNELTERREEAEHYEIFLKENQIPYLKVYYEDLFDLHLAEAQKLQKIDEIFAFTGVEPPAGSMLENIKEHLHPQNKLNTLETYGKIPNIMDVEEKFGSEEWGYLFK